MRNQKTFKRLTTRSLFAGALAVCLLPPDVLMAQDFSSDPPVLSLNEAIQLALLNNRSMRIAGFEVDKSKWQIADLHS